MVIAGRAVLVHGRPRLTEDVEITLGAPPDEWRLTRDVCADLERHDGHVEDLNYAYRAGAASVCSAVAAGEGGVGVGAGAEAGAWGATFRNSGR